MTSVEPALIVMASAPDAALTPAVPTPSLTMLIDLVMVIGPKPPGSSTSISPPAVVWVMAKAKVRHGCVRVQAPLSVPVPDTQVRRFVAEAGVDDSAAPSASRDAVILD